jgi:spermidine synthase
VHGGTRHGAQWLDPAKAAEPLTYYHPSGPCGDIFALSSPRRVVLVGLGTAALASYLQPGMSMTFVEIDPGVVELARDYFTYLERCGADCEVVVADGRQWLEQPALSAAAEPERYDLIVIDAFNGGTIPIHMLTAEAFAAYRRRLAPGGVLAVHVSNHFIRVASVAERAGGAAGLALVQRYDGTPTAAGVYASQWVALGEANALAPFLARGWTELSEKGREPLWTDRSVALWRSIRW